MGVNIDSYLPAPILDAKYEKLDIYHVVKTHCSYRSLAQQADLQALLARHTKLFDGMLGKYPGKPIHIELLEGLQPVYWWSYPVLVVHMDMFLRELNHLVEIGVLSPTRDTEQGASYLYNKQKWWAHMLGLQHAQTEQGDQAHTVYLVHH